jgi:predicted MFS family arabinose efflux permease
MMPREKLWTRNFTTISTVFFLVALVFYLLMVTMGVYAAEQFKVSESVAGLVTGIYIIGSLMGRMMTGSLIVRTGGKKALLLGVGLFTIASGLYFFASSIPLLLGIRFLHGISSGITLNASATIVALIVPFSRRAEGIGYFSTASVLSAAVGPFLGIFLSQHTNLNTIFTFCLMLSVMSLILSTRLDDPPVEVPGNIPQTHLRGLNLSNLFETSALPISLVILLIGLAYSSVLSFITMYAKTIDLVSAASFYFLVYAITIVLTRPFTGRITDLKGVNIVAYPTLFFFAAGMLLLSQAHHGATLLIAGSAIGFGYGNFNSVAQTIAIRKVPPERIALATSTFFIFLELGLGAGPYLLGTMIPLLGYRNMYVMMAGMVIAAAAFYHVFYGRKE